MDKEQIQKLIGRLSGDEIEHLKRLQLHGSEVVTESRKAQTIIQSLEVQDLVFRSGSVVSLTYRGKLISRNL